jgi:hypothetical protein
METFENAFAAFSHYVGVLSKPCLTNRNKSIHLGGLNRNIFHQATAQNKDIFFCK